MSALILPAPFPAGSSSLHVPGASLCLLSLWLISTSCGLTPSPAAPLSQGPLPGQGWVPCPHPRRAHQALHPVASLHTALSLPCDPAFLSETSIGFFVFFYWQTWAALKLHCPPVLGRPSVHRMLLDEPSFLLTASELVPPAESRGLHAGSVGLSFSETPKVCSTWDFHDIKLL